MQADRRAGQIGRLAGVPAGRQASVYATIRIKEDDIPY